MNRKKLLLRFINFWPPFVGAGIHIDFMSKSLDRIDVSLKLRFWNRNYVGTQYGGSLYSMTDPFYMLMLMNLLGRDYIIWDKAATIRFKRPGTTKVYAHFVLSQEQIEDFREQLKTQEKIEPILSVNVVDEGGVVIAIVDKTIYIKKKK